MLCGLLRRVGWRGRGWDASWASGLRTAGGAARSKPLGLGPRVHPLAQCLRSSSFHCSATWGLKQPQPRLDPRACSPRGPRATRGMSSELARLRPGQAQRLLWEWCPSFIHSFIHS